MQHEHRQVRSHAACRNGACVRAACAWRARALAGYEGAAKKQRFWPREKGVCERVAAVKVPLEHAIPPLPTCSLHRFAVKGMGPDALSRVHLEPGDAFPHDREWALLKVESREKFSEQAPAWLHKENFECVFTAGEALAALETHFDDKSCTLSVRHRAQAGMVTANLQDEADVVALESFLARDVFDARPVKIVKGAGPHQFGNTHLGVKHSQDTRTIHIINASTVEEVSQAIGRPLDPMRFRANVILDGLKPWEEFEWVQRGQVRSLRTGVGCETQCLLRSGLLIQSARSEATSKKQTNLFLTLSVFNSDSAG